MKERDVRAFIRNERQKLVAYVYSRLSVAARVDAEDLVHDVLINILERADVLAPEYLAAYVYRSLRNRVIDKHRTDRPTVSLHAESEQGDGRFIDLLKDLRPNPLDALQTTQGREQLFKALDGLSEMERKVVIAHEFEGVPFKELSRRWDIPQNTLLSHKSRAMKKLKRHFLSS